jgi:hypothetical protein
MYQVKRSFVKVVQRVYGLKLDWSQAVRGELVPAKRHFAATMVGRDPGLVEIGEPPQSISTTFFL